MTIARRAQVRLSSTPYYHCVSRCVRRAFLCGRDRETGRSFDHRKHWIESRIRHLSSVFAIDVCAYAVMDNHYHVVLHIDESRASAWSTEEVITRWLKLFRGTPLVDRHIDGSALSSAERSLVKKTASLWRARLHDLGWFMRCLNEPIARQANREDGCRGRFWEGRYRCQALLDEGALLTCMAYVDLNPIRAGMAESIETSKFTSVRALVHSRAAAAWRPKPNANAEQEQPETGLMIFMDPKKPQSPCALPVTITEYLQLVDWTGRAIRNDRRGYIPDYVLPVCQRLQLEPTEWTHAVHHFGRRFHRVTGAIDRIRKFAHEIGRRWLKGERNCRRLFKPQGISQLRHQHDL